MWLCLEIMGLARDELSMMRLAWDKGKKDGIDASWN